VKFTETSLEGAYIIEIDPIEDDRGFFARTWCHHEFEEQGLNTKIAQCSTSFNSRKGTLRGMHYQDKPFQETKVVRCIMGAVYDVIVDLRVESPTYLKWISIELTAINRKMVYIPVGFAHGFQSLEDNTEVFYQISEFFKPELSRGIRWNDQAFGFTWPIQQCIMSERDKNFPDFVSQ
jgi:dTDP-4-dehydrorhamnose 3,5-epimerase